MRHVLAIPLIDDVELLQIVELRPRLISVEMPFDNDPTLILSNTDYLGTDES